MSSVEELTTEQKPYAIELAGGKKCGSVFRKGSKWYDDAGQHVADSSEITAIQIPARRS